jgi:diacylglycerol O-acyltransferase / wax synthase
MSQAGRTDSLSWGDTFFLFLEREGQPLNIASTCEFEGVIALPAFRKFVESKLSLLPRYKQRVVFPPFNIGLPSWEPDPNFDIRNHVHQVVLKGGTDRELKDVTAKIISSRLDRQRPLWDLTLVRGLKGNHTGMVIRLHHCMADGISGVGIMHVLLDTSATPEKIAAIPERREAPSTTDSIALLLNQTLKTYQSFVQGAVTAQAEVVNIARGLLAGATNGHTDDIIHLVPELATPSQRLPFNVICRGPQRIAWGEIPMADIKAIRQNCGGTVNDVILTVVTATIRRYAALHGVKLGGRQLRIIVPVNVRGNGDVTELGNRITFLPINLPLDVRDPRMLLARVGERMAFLRGIGVTEVVGFMGSLISKIPLPAQAFLAPLITQLPLSLCNMICTNVPGPQQPLYLLGHELLRCYPYVPIGGEMGVNVAILSYNGTAYVGFGGDVHAVPDIDCFEEMLRESFGELRKLTTVNLPKTETRAAKAAVATAPRSARAKTIAVAPSPRAKKPKAKPVASAEPKKRKRGTVSIQQAVSLPPTPEAVPAEVAVGEEELVKAGD